MDILTQVIGDVLTRGGSLGLVTWLLVGGLFKLWQERWGEPRNSTKVLVSVAAPFLIVLAFYYVGVYFEVVAYNKTTLANAIGLAVAEILGSKVWFGVTRKVEEKTARQAA